jgi:hypothetical protein
VSNVEFRAIVPTVTTEALDEQQDARRQDNERKEWQDVVVLAMAQPSIAAQGIEVGPMALFAEHTRRTAIGAYVDGELIGVGISHIQPDDDKPYSGVDVLAVREENRRQHVGSGLLGLLQFHADIGEVPLKVRVGDVRDAPEFFAALGMEVPPDASAEELIRVPPLPASDI